MAEASKTKTVHSPLVTYLSMVSLLTLCPPFVVLLPEFRRNMFCVAGFYVCWGCLAWVPSVYTFPGMYLVSHPVNLGTQLALLILFAGILCIYINYDCDSQRQEFRRTSGKCLVWGKAPSKIVATYTTTSGETKNSLLLTSGWGGLSHHFHYVLEILGAFFWTVPALFTHFLPYFYVIFLTILLLDRAKRDDDRCRTKYGKYWKSYCDKLPDQIIPGIY